MALTSEGPENAQPPASNPTVSAVEAALLGSWSRDEIDDWVSRVMAELLGERVTSTLFRAGRIDAVYGLLVESGQRRLLKVHRRPVDIEGRRLVNRAQSLLADAGLPCATPLAGPSIVDDQVVSVESLLPAGQPGDGFNAGVQMAVAEGLAQQVTLLAAHPDVIDGIRRPPAWCYYERGAWGATHDPIFDFRTTPSEYAWLRDYAQDAADELNTTRTDARVVAAHADWYCGNLRFDGDRLVAAFDWDLFADREPVVAGITAGMFSAGTSGPAGPPTPQAAAGFLRDYEIARAIRFSPVERTLAQAAVRWSLAYTARCDVTQAHGGPFPPGSALDLLTRQRGDYVDLDW